MANNNKAYENCWAVNSEGKSRKNDDLKRKQQEERKLENSMVEMFGHLFDRLTIQDVLINHEYNVDKCLESLLKMSDDTSLCRNNNDPFEKIAFSIIKNDENETLIEDNSLSYAEMALQASKPLPKHNETKKKDGSIDAVKLPKPPKTTSPPTETYNPTTHPLKTLLTPEEAQSLLDHHYNKSHKLLVLLRGCPGSGKTTLARQLKHKGVVLSTDDYFHKADDSYSFDATFLSEAHSLNAIRTGDHMKQGTTPIIIDNTNTQSWQMLPYVKLAVDHGYKVEVIEPKTAWRFKPGKLAKLNQHSVSADKIKRIIDTYEHNISADSLLQMIYSKRPQTEAINKHHNHLANQLHSSTIQTYNDSGIINTTAKTNTNNNNNNNSTKNNITENNNTIINNNKKRNNSGANDENNKTNKSNKNKKSIKNHNTNNTNNNQAFKSASDNSITIKSKGKTMVDDNGEEVFSPYTASFSEGVSYNNRYFYLNQVECDHESGDSEMVDENDVICTLKIPIDVDADVTEKLKLDSKLLGNININEMLKIETLEDEINITGDNNCDNELKRCVVEDKQVINNGKSSDVKLSEAVETEGNSNELIVDDNFVNFSDECPISKETSTEPRDWLVVDHMTTNRIEVFENFKLLRSKLMLDCNPVLFYNENNTEETYKNDGKTDSKDAQKQIVMNKAKDPKTWHDSTTSRNYQDPMKQDNSAQTEDEDNDDDWQGLLDEFAHVDKKRLKHLYYCCNRSTQLLSHIINDFEPRVSDNKSKETDDKTTNKDDKIDSNCSEKKQNRSFKASTAYVFKSASSKGIVDSNNTRVFNPTTKYKDSIRRTDVPSPSQALEEQCAVEHSLEISTQTAYNIWKIFSQEDIAITGDVTLKLDNLTAQSLFHSLRDALNIISTDYISSQSEHLSTRIKFKKLCGIFPNVNKDVLHNIFQASGYSHEVCADVVRSSGLDQPATVCMTEDFKQKLELQLIQQAIHASLQDQEARGQPVELALSTDLDCTYDAILQRASHTQHLLSQLREQAKEALRAKRYEVYSYYNERQNEMMEKLKEEKNLAAEILFQKKFDIGQGVLDLHGFTCEEVSNKLPTILQFQMLRVQKGSKKRGHLSIITGRGNNSPGGVAKLKPLVINYLRKNNYSFKLTTPGIIKVFLTA